MKNKNCVKIQQIVEKSYAVQMEKARQYEK